MWVANDQALPSQIFNEVEFDFETNAPGNLTFTNGGIFTSRSAGAGI